MCVHTFAHTSHLPELHAENWVRQHPSEGAEESAQCQEAPAGEDDSDTDLTYGEVEQRLDMLQQHLNRCAGARGVERTVKQHVGHVKPQHFT